MYLLKAWVHVFTMFTWKEWVWNACNYLFDCNMIRLNLLKAFAIINERNQRNDCVDLHYSFSRVNFFILLCINCFNTESRVCLSSSYGILFFAPDSWANPQNLLEHLRFHRNFLLSVIFAENFRNETYIEYLVTDEGSSRN